MLYKFKRWVYVPCKTEVFIVAESDQEAIKSMDFIAFDEQAKIKEEKERIQGILDRPQNGDRVSKLRLDMGTSMNDNIAVYRDEQGIKQTVNDLKDMKVRYQDVPVDSKGKIFNTDLIFHLELGFMLDVAETIAAGALERKESRGAQSRTDYPDRDDENWLKHILVTQGEDGPVLSTSEVSITQWEPVERTY